MEHLMSKEVGEVPWPLAGGEWVCACVLKGVEQHQPE